MAILRRLREDYYRLKDRLSIWFSYWKTTERMYDFDYSSILEAERHQLKRVIKSIDKYRSHVNVERDLFWMRMCVYLLDVIIDNTHDEWNGKDIVMNKYCNTRNYKRFFPNMSEDTKNKLKYFPNDLYEHKAWNLYHKIRLEYMRSWWD